MTEQYMMSVITGSKSLDDHETFLKELDGTGMSRYEEMLTNAYKEMKDVIE